jgi:hypothetical protein
VTIARALSDTYAGIAPAGIAAFIAAQLLGAPVAVALARWLFVTSNVALSLTNVSKSGT